MRAKKLIAEIEASGPDDDYYDAKVKVLSEMIKHHVKEEEQPGGMFAEARKSDMDLDALGEQMAARKGELESARSATSRRARARRTNGDSRAHGQRDRLARPNVRFGGDRTPAPVCRRRIPCRMRGTRRFSDFGFQCAFGERKSPSTRQ